MVSKEREAELFRSWYDEQCDSWRDDCEESEKWREELTEEEKTLVAGWDRETPEEMINNAYIVRWCDHEGNQHEREFRCLRSAVYDALYLREKFRDPVEIVHAGSGEPVEVL